jgi:hypothetical protein
LQKVAEENAIHRTDAGSNYMDGVDLAEFDSNAGELASI